MGRQPSTKTMQIRAAILENPDVGNTQLAKVMTEALRIEVTPQDIAVQRQAMKKMEATDDRREQEEHAEHVVEALRRVEDMLNEPDDSAAPVSAAPAPVSSPPATVVGRVFPLRQEAPGAAPARDSSAPVASQAPVSPAPGASSAPGSASSAMTPELFLALRQLVKKVGYAEVARWLAVLKD